MSHDPVSAAQDFPPNTQLGAYRIEECVGAGGMGMVYRAVDTKLGRSVALKIIRAESMHDAGLARFEREARLLASLNHPHIAAIHGMEESGGTRFLVLEYIPGPTLADRLRRGPLPVREAMLAAKQIAEALEAAHAKGVIHRTEPFAGAYHGSGESRSFQLKSGHPPVQFRSFEVCFVDSKILPTPTRQVALDGMVVIDEKSRCAFTRPRMSIQKLPPGIRRLHALRDPIELLRSASRPARSFASQRPRPFPQHASPSSRPSA